MFHEQPRKEEFFEGIIGILKKILEREEILGGILETVISEILNAIFGRISKTILEKELKYSSRNP